VEAAILVVEDNRDNMELGYISKPIAPESFVAQVEGFLAPELQASTSAPTSGP
jgi:hypothetical protein